MSVEANFINLITDIQNNFVADLIPNSILDALVNPTKYTFCWQH